MILARLLYVAPAFLAVMVMAVLRVVRRKNADLILRASLGRRARATPPVHIFFCVVDHFEPFWKNDDLGLALERVRRWRERYPGIAASFRDYGGKPPRHGFFYPAEDYDRSPQCVEMLAELVRQGVAEVEVH
ncbi:MAG TPA: hypothetical protein VFH33_07720, partial [Candidatus Krumholzibacteria bacterium]|nr:hypothetical protein [Candidatus Krumholzibacteria bacterium]